MAVGFTLGLRLGWPMRGMLGGTAVGLLIGLVLRSRMGGGEPSDADPEWVHYPHARREMARELVFLAPAIVLSVIGWWLAKDAGGAPPLWLRALTGSVAGLIAGGGIVWAVRIAGSLAFGKEAMGLGDVHLMAAVGAVLGWVDPVLAFFIAPFFGIAWTVLSALARLGKGGGAALPYGPHLAAATLVMIYAKPAVEAGLSMIAGRTIDLP
ncbi:MAG: prepilin peptidase [Planctomycetota bacterium]|nr:MAG: prepilin peptidase [Planctomycetota bacterium]